MLTSEAIMPDREDAGGARAPMLRMGRLSRAAIEDGAAVLHGENAIVGIRRHSEGIVRIRLIVEGEPDWRTTPAVLPVAGTMATRGKMECGGERAASAAVTAEAAEGTDRRIAAEGKDEASPGELSVREVETAFVVSTDALSVIVDKDGRSFRVVREGGETLARGLDLSWDVERRTTLALEMAEESRFYGLGEKTGFLDKRGERYEMWNSDVYAPHVPDIDALYQSIPFVIHYRYGAPACGLFLDDPGRSAFDMRMAQDRFAIQSENGRLDLYVLDGPGLKDVVRRYAALTGKPPMPPRWAIGYQQSRYSYMNREELMDVARTMREKRIPCDVLYLDIHYMDGYRVFTWDPARFPDPEGMLAELAEMGFHVVPIVDPGVKKDPKYGVYAEGVREGRFCRKLEGETFIGNVWPGPSAFVDFTDEEAARWWGDLHKVYVDQGIRGIWNDMNEPSVFDTDSKTMDTDVVHRNGGDPKTHGEWHNLYGLLMSKATYEGMTRSLDGERPFVLTRAGYAGIQRYSAVWTGDNRSYWEHMAMSIPMVLNLGLSGVAFAGPDVGGFSHHASGELVARWTQMGALFPFCRNHSAIDTRHQEPWRFGERIESVCREALELRYRLLPYLYSLFYEATATGLPIVRPLLLEYPDDPLVSNLCDQFLLGSDLLVAPILRPGTYARSVYLPEGEWIDWHTGERLAGGRFVLAAAPLEAMPMYARAGGILAEQPLRQYADEDVEGPTTLRVYAGGSGVFRLFEDDGRTFGYESGAYRLREFEWTEADRLDCDGLASGEGSRGRVPGREAGESGAPFGQPAVDRSGQRSWTLTVRVVNDGYRLADATVRVIVCGLTAKPASVFAADAGELPHRFDPQRGELAFELYADRDVQLDVRG